MKNSQRQPDTRPKPVPSESTAAAPIPFPGASSSPVILVVDDNNALRRLLAYGLQSEGYEVLCARDGEEGLQLLSKKHFDLLITDNEMPRLRGLDLLRKMRAQAWEQPAILISGDLPWNEPDLGKLLTPGVAMGKPFSIVELLLKIRELVPKANREGEDPISPGPVSGIM